MGYRSAPAWEQSSGALQRSSSEGLRRLAGWEQRTQKLFYDFVFRPVWLLLANALLSKLMDVMACLERHEDTLLSGHRVKNTGLHGGDFRFRSEERRVGKECTSRWSVQNEK